ncbi:hypothetical protein [Heyndrickxia coagulans]|uniref:hypothetical protein n=1 Tax=Heyndrickxia coagulans TaxID=1398 RepID=UPI0002D51848|nr:hypothetical protein [Heyndrickxia coagulans]
MTKFFKPLMLPCALKKDPSLFQGMNAVYQFNLSGEEEGAYHVVMRPKNRYGLPAKNRESLYSW